MAINLGEILLKYWWVLGIIIVAFAIWVWTKQDAYTKNKLKKIFSGKTLIIIGVAVGWFAWYKLGGTVEIKYANQWMPIICLLILVATFLIGKLRYDTQQFISPNFHGSFSNPPFRLNGYLIFAIDSFNAGGLSWEYAGRILIVREETCELFDFGAVSIARTGWVSKYELPEEILKFVSNNKFLKRATSEISYGWFDELERVDWNFEQLGRLEKIKEQEGIYNLLKKELGVANPKVATLYWLFKNQNKALNKQTEYYDSTVESVEKGVEHHKRVKDAYVDKPEKPFKSEGFEEN